MSLEQHLIEIDQYPPRVRWLRPQINAALHRPPRHDITTEVENYFILNNPGSTFGDGLYPKGPPISSFCDVTQAHSNLKPLPMKASFLGEERPPAVVRAIERPPARPFADTYASRSGSYAFSVVGNIPVLLKTDGGTPEIVTELSSPYCEAVGIKGGRRLWRKPSIELDKAALIYDEVVGHNFAHWLLDWFPRFALLERAGARLSELRVILTRPLAQYQRESLAAIGVDERQCVIANAAADRPNSFLGMRNFFGSSTTSFYEHPLHGGADWSLQFLRDKLAPQRSTPSGKLILNRRDSRRMHFEEPGMELLQRAGFKVVFSEDLTFREQIALFSGAEAVLAAHGAGLANLVFCPEGTQVLEVFPAGYSMASILVLSTAANLQYSCAFGPLFGERDVARAIRDHDLWCPTKIVEEWLDVLASQGRR